MPRKSKKSQSVKLQWQKRKEFDCAAVSQQAECPGPQTTRKVNVAADCSGTSVQEESLHDEPSVPRAPHADIHQSDPTYAVGPSNTDKVNHRGQSSVSSLPKRSYADVLKKGHSSDAACVAGPSHAHSVNLGDQPHETCVRASYSQASMRYGRSRNSQCTCNSLTFLAFLHEDENFTRTDLDLVLDKGDVMYKDARKRFPANTHLATDELPDEAAARRCVYRVDMTQPSRYGTFGEPLPGAVDSFLDLEAGLSCLLSDVEYALLMTTGLCIAVFRTRTNKYGFFDPHSRTAKGLPLPLGSNSTGTAVMLTFPHLSDMIDRLTRCHQILGTQSSCAYELKPVAFYNLQHTEARSTPNKTVTPAPLDDARSSSNATITITGSPTTSANTETELEQPSPFCINSASSHVALRNDAKLSAQPLKLSINMSDNISQGVSTNLRYLK